MVAPKETRSQRAGSTATKEEMMGIWPFSDDNLRAMYAGGRAGAPARRLAHLWAAAFGLGLMPKRWVTLEVAGRRSGRIVRFPLGMADWGGRRHLVPMRAEAGAGPPLAPQAFRGEGPGTPPPPPRRRARAGGGLRGHFVALPGLPGRSHATAPDGTPAPHARTVTDTD